MAIAYDSSATGTGNTTSLSFSHTCSGSDRILFVGFFQDGTNDVTGVTYAGVSMTELTPATERPTDSGFYHLFYLIAPATGANNVVISKTAAAGIYADSASYTGVDQSSPIDSDAEASGKPVSGLTMTTTVVASNCWLVGGVLCDNSNIQAGASTTIRQGTGAAYAICDSNATVSTGSQSLIVTSNSNSGAAAKIASFKPVAAAGPTTVKTWDGVTQSTGIKTYKGVAIASVKTVDGAT